MFIETLSMRERLPWFQPKERAPLRQNASMEVFGCPSCNPKNTPSLQSLKGSSFPVLADVVEKSLPYMRGWRGYFGLCETPEVLVALTRWVRLRLRAALWRQWKTPRRRRAALIALRVSGELRNTAGSGRGPWYIARSKAFSVGLSNAYFKSLGVPT